jgi:uncharacterized membrane protein
MNWLIRYRLRHYLGNSIWILPFLSIFVAMTAIRFFYWLDVKYDWELGMQPETARAMLSTLASSMFTFIVFVCSALLVAVQLASAQLTPRIIALVFRNTVTRLCLSLFVFTFTFSASALIRVSDTVPPLTTYAAAYACVLSLGVFLFLIDHVGKSLRPSGALRAVASLGRQVIESVYPHPWVEGQKPAPSPVAPLAGQSPTLTIDNPRDGVVLAFDVAGLTALAQQADCLIELVPQVGDDIAAGDPLLRVYGGGSSLNRRRLRHSVVVSFERTMEQDATFAFRIMVDIANKGLSPAINDPTTAVLAIDQIHHLLRFVGTRDLDTGSVCDSAGRLRLVYRTPDWEDFVHLAVTEIRHFGGESIQIARRLRAMLDDLIRRLPATRTELLRKELTLLHRSAERFFSEPEDRALAEVSDAQGVGGKRGGG